MSLQTTHSLTPAEVDARRQNAQKSSGPRTPEGKRFARANAIQHGHYARRYSEAFRETIRVLKEDPDEFERLRQRLLGDLAGGLPEDPSRAGSTQSLSAEAPSDKPAGEPSAGSALTASPGLSPLLVFAIEELAQLHWEVDRERRCQNRLRRRRLAVLDLELRRRQWEISTDEYERVPLLLGGIENAPLSADRFKDALHRLAELLAQVDRGDFQNYHGDFHYLYDGGVWELSEVGSRILTLFRRLSGKYDGILPPPEADSAAKLRAELVAEIAKYTREYEDFKPTWPVISEEERERARSLETLALADEDDPERVEWERSLQREDYLRRAIDRKLRTILAIRREARLDEAHQARMSARSTAVAGGARGSTVATDVGGPASDRRRPGTPVLPGREAREVGAEAPTPVRAAGPAGAPAATVGDTGEPAPERGGPRTPVLRREKSKNEGTNRGTHLESVTGSRGARSESTERAPASAEK